MDSDIDRAKRLLTHYFQHCWNYGNYTWSDDNRVEIEEIVDRIVAAMVEVVREEIRRELQANP